MPVAMSKHGVSQEWQTELEWHAGGFGLSLEGDGEPLENGL